MREIKFRAWDKKANKYRSILLIHVSENGIFGIELGTDDGKDVVSRFGDEVTLEQFTGLQDKNGVEIYEGDILNDASWWWGPCAIKYCQGTVGPCKGDNVMEWRLYNKTSDVHNLWDGSEVEVIGNIRENQELLEGSHV